MKILVGCEESQAVTIELRRLGHEAYSCDLQPCSGGYPQWHIQQDIMTVIDGGAFVLGKDYSFEDEVIVKSWDMGIFFPDCTYLTCSAEWAYKEGPYHQKLKEGTLFGMDRVEARRKAADFFMALYNCRIPKVAIENPVGVMSRLFRPPDQIIQPWQFGDDASKATCLWLKGLSKLVSRVEDHVAPRIVGGKKRWGNQTDSGQNRLSPSPDRAKMRSKTYSGIAKSMAKQWAGLKDVKKGGGIVGS